MINQFADAELYEEMTGLRDRDDEGLGPITYENPFWDCGIEHTCVQTHVPDEDIPF